MAQHGRYTVVRKLAKGGMAEIFLASQQGHEGFQKPVVLKRILGAIYSDPQFRNMLIDEAHISMSLTHSNIVQVLDLGLAGGRYFLVLELVDGWDLGQVLQRGKLAGMPLPTELGIFIVTDMCRALAYAHAKRGPDGQPLGIVHRDVSPNNVLISEHGEVKLADFGIAKAMNKREHTGTGVVKGKVAFMSPEQGLGKPIDHRSDVFSLGTLLYVVSVGARPFEAPTDLEILLRVQHAEFVPPGAVRPDLPPELTAVIMRAMQLSPDDRYQSADDMLLDLERVQRSVYGGAGQTELKQYLADLGRRDGIPPIGRAQPLVDHGGESSGDAELVEGNAVVLADARDDLATDRTDLAELMAVDGGSEPRYSRRTIDLGRIASSDLMHGREPTPPRSGRRVVEELSLSNVGTDDAPPVRYRRRKSRLFPTLFVLVLIGVGGYAAARYFGWSERIVGGAATPASSGAMKPAAPPAESPPVPAPSVAAKPSPAPAAAPAAAPPAPVPTSAATRGHGDDDRRAAAPPTPPPAPPHAAPEAPKHAASPTRRSTARSERSAGKAHAPSAREVFRESGKRVRSLSQGLDQLPPGTIQPANPPAGETPPPAPPQ